MKFALSILLMHLIDINNHLKVHGQEKLIGVAGTELSPAVFLQIQYLVLRECTGY